jgi:hypothetical protein
MTWCHSLNLSTSRTVKVSLGSRYSLLPPSQSPTTPQPSPSTRVFSLVSAPLSYLSGLSAAVVSSEYPGARWHPPEMPPEVTTSDRADVEEALLEVRFAEVTGDSMS